MSVTNQKQTVLIFSGGGTRMGIYCGMYAALEDIGMIPDYVIASCGGSLSLAVINAFDDNTQRKDYLFSQELFSFIQRLHTTSKTKLNQLPMYCLGKMFNAKNATKVENVIDNFLVEFPQNLQFFLPSLYRVSPTVTHRSVIVGSRLLFAKEQVNSKRLDGQKLYKKVFFTDEHTKEIIQSHYPTEILLTGSAIDDTIEIDTSLQTIDAARISISDMFYVAPVFRDCHYYAGGAIDLIPIELAQILGDTILLQDKKGYTKLENALVKAVLGYDGNDRMNDIKKKMQSLPIIRIDTKDEKVKLKGYYSSRKISWRTGMVEIQKPNTLEIFRQQMEAQWNYGYEKIKKVLDNEGFHSRRN